MKHRCGLSILNFLSGRTPSVPLSGMNKVMIQAELPAELTVRARTFVTEGWASDLDELLTDALRRFLESHSSRVTEAFVMEDVKWGLSGDE